MRAVGRFHSNSGIRKLNKDVAGRRRLRDPSIRYLDHSRIGPVLMGHEDALYGGPPVTALLIQNTNPVNVAPEQRLVKQGFLRDDLFTCVHEQFMTDTAQLADVVLPARCLSSMTTSTRAAATSTSRSARS
jgi:anaerobic selenocysteine-containing dehydrogenase